MFTSKVKREMSGMMKGGPQLQVVNLVMEQLIEDRLQDGSKQKQRMIEDYAQKAAERDNMIKERKDEDKSKEAAKKKGKPKQRRTPGGAGILFGGHAVAGGLGLPDMGQLRALGIEVEGLENLNFVDCSSQTAIMEMLGYSKR
jgi:hypothetical protein